eukprot:scaffold1328_cov394-Prasinococcus_capsulatus_cf.AAC.22
MSLCETYNAYSLIHTRTVTTKRPRLIKRPLISPRRQAFGALRVASERFIALNLERDGTRHRLQQGTGAPCTACIWIGEMATLIGSREGLQTALQGAEITPAKKSRPLRSGARTASSRLSRTPSQPPPGMRRPLRRRRPPRWRPSSPRVRSVRLRMWAARRTQALGWLWRYPPARAVCGRTAHGRRSDSIHSQLGIETKLSDTISDRSPRGGSC